MKKQCQVNDAKVVRREKSESLQWKEIGLVGKKWLKRNTGMNALLMDAQMLLSMEVCVLGMGQRSNYAAVKDAQIML